MFVYGCVYGMYFIGIFSLIQYSLSHNKWGVVCREILPQSDRVQSISSVGRGGSLLVGVANMNLLLW